MPQLRRSRDREHAHTITGSPHGFDFVRIEGPNIADAGGPRDPDDPGNLNEVLTRQFTVQGRLAKVAGVEVTRAMYRRTAGGAVKPDVFAGSEPDQTLTASVAGLADIPLQDADAIYYASVDTGSVVPASVSVTNTTDSPPSVATFSVADVVEIAKADFDSAGRPLTVAATSSDAKLPPTLTVSGPNLPDSAVGDVSVAAPPAVVTVHSSHGGSATRDVRGIN